MLESPERNLIYANVKKYGEEKRMIAWESVFPTPVMRSSIGRKFTDDERKYFRKLQAAPHENVSNVRSADTQVLDAPEMRAIRSTIAEHVNQYAWKVISSDPKHEFYITQSWVNYTHTGQSHHRHIHTNSLISGVLYLQAKKELDSICFYRSNNSQIVVSDEQQNCYNAPSWCFSVDTGDLILFPSNLSHGVEQTAGEHIRMSLAFNAFVRGECGNRNRLNSLVI